MLTYLSNNVVNFFHVVMSISDSLYKIQRLYRIPIQIPILYPMYKHFLWLMTLIIPFLNPLPLICKYDFNLVQPAFSVRPGFSISHKTKREKEREKDFAGEKKNCSLYTCVEWRKKQHAQERGGSRSAFLYVKRQKKGVRKKIFNVYTRCFIHGRLCWLMQTGETDSKSWKKRQICR